MLRLSLSSAATQDKPFVAYIVSGPLGTNIWVPVRYGTIPYGNTFRDSKAVIVDPRFSFPPGDYRYEMTGPGIAFIRPPAPKPKSALGKRATAVASVAVHSGRILSAAEVGLLHPAYVVPGYAGPFHPHVAPIALAPHMVIPNMSMISSLKASPFPTAKKPTASHISPPAPYTKKGGFHMTASHIGNTGPPQPSIASVLSETLNSWRLVEDPVQQSVLQQKLDVASNANFEWGACLEQAKINLPNNKGSVQIPMMLSISEKLLGAKGAVTCLIDVVCAIDVSGSMQGEKMSYVKKSLKLMLNFLDNSRLALVLFSNTAEIVMNFKTVNSDNRARIEQLIDSLFIIKDTNITDSVKLAQKMIGQRKHKNPACSVFVLSDGIHNRGPISNDALFSEEKFSTGDENYSIHTFGYGDDHDAQQLQSIAEHKFGNYYFVNDLERVDEYFVDCIGSITSTLALEGKINFKFTLGDLIKGIKVVKAHGPYFKSHSKGLWSLSLPNLYAGMSKDFILMLQLDYDKAAQMQPTQVELASMSLSFKRIGANSRVSTEKKLSVLIEHGSKVGKPEINLEVRKNYLRVRAAEVMAWAEAHKKPDYNKAISELRKFQQFELGNEPALLGDPVVISINSQISQLIEMLTNEMHGKKNKVKLVNFVVENAHLMQQQQSNPVSAYGALNRNAYQCSNVGRLASMKVAYY